MWAEKRHLCLVNRYSSNSIECAQRVGDIRVGKGVTIVVQSNVIPPNRAKILEMIYNCLVQVVSGLSNSKADPEK